MNETLEMISCDVAPRPLGNYSHAVAFGNLVVVSGIGPRDPKTNEVPGLVLDSSGNKLKYDIQSETRLTLKTIEKILLKAGSSLEKVMEIQVYLTNMGDFEAYNRVYSEFFTKHRPARTTIGVASLPGKISIEMKALAVRSL